MLYIGLDIGTTSICGILTDSVSGEIIRSVTLPNDSFISRENSWEKIQDCGIIFDTVMKILGELGTDGVKGIGISNQMHGILYTDEKGDALTPLFIWQDARGDLPYGNGTYSSAFGAPSGYGLTTDFYNEINGLIPEKTYRLCTIGDWVAMKLCGRKTPLTHITNAASLGKFSVTDNAFTVDNLRLPEVTAEFESVGEYNGITVCTAIGDNQASFIGSAKADSVLLNVGTGSQISFLTDDTSDVPDTEIRPFDGRKYLRVGAALCGGRAFSVFEKFMARVYFLATGEQKNMYPVIDKMLESIDTTSLEADTRFCGTRGNPSIKGSITGITESNFTPENVALAVLEGIASELYTMFANTSAVCTSLTGSGNGIRKNAKLRGIAEAMFGQKMHIPAHCEEASFGAALTAMIASGEYSCIEEAQKLIRYQGEDNVL